MLLVVAAMVSVFTALLVQAALESFSAKPLQKGRIGKEIRRILKSFDQGEKDVIASQVPDMIDVVALAVHGGSSLESAITRYVEAYPDRELSHEMARTLRSYQLGISTREQAFEELEERTVDSSLARFKDVVVHSLDLGSPLVSELTRLAAEVRGDRVMKLQTRIEKAPVKMVIPMTGLVLPALLLTILGPFFSAYV